MHALPTGLLEHLELLYTAIVLLHRPWCMHSTRLANTKCCCSPQIYAKPTALCFAQSDAALCSRHNKSSVNTVDTDTQNRDKIHILSQA